MNDTLYMIWAFIAGIGLGTLFFGGLWLTVKKAVTSKTPALLFFGSLFLRLSVTLAGFYFVGSGDWQKMLICLFGFIAARFIVTRLTKSYEEKQIQLTKDVSHET
jgi:F1F0 ATPase subunit 2